VKRVSLRLACVFLLLFAQQSALTHAAWHAHGQVPAQHHDGEDKASFQGSLCSLHVVFSQVLGGVHTTTLQPPAPEHFVEQTTQHEYSHCVEVHLPFLSRAPPVLL